MKYRNNWFDPAPQNQLIVWIGPPFQQEVYGWKRDSTIFDPVQDSSTKGFLPKWWRETTESEKQSFTDPLNVINLPNVKKKRGRPAKTN